VGAQSRLLLGGVMGICGYLFKLLVVLSVIAFSNAAQAAQYISKNSATLKISVRIIENCAVNKKEWCEQRAQCCEAKQMPKAVANTYVLAGGGIYE
jgi:hypothetical protein